VSQERMCVEVGISMSWNSGSASSSTDSTLTLSSGTTHEKNETKERNQKYIKEVPHLPQGVEGANYFIFVNKTLLEHRHTVHVHIILPTTMARLRDGHRDHIPGKV